jgi:hypothetical protein
VPDDPAMRRTEWAADPRLPYALPAFTDVSWYLQALVTPLLHSYEACDIAPVWKTPYADRG